MPVHKWEMRPDDQRPGQKARSTSTLANNAFFRLPRHGQALRIQHHYKAVFLNEFLARQSGANHVECRIDGGVQRPMHHCPKRTHSEQEGASIHHAQNLSALQLWDLHNVALHVIVCVRKAKRQDAQVGLLDASVHEEILVATDPEVRARTVHLPNHR